MELLVKISPSHYRRVTDDAPYLSGLEMPHFLSVKSGQATLILPRAVPLTEGDMLSSDHGREFMVMEILERRKARGDWSKNPFDAAPDWARIKFL